MPWRGKHAYAHPSDLLFAFYGDDLSHWGKLIGSAEHLRQKLRGCRAECQSWFGEQGLVLFREVERNLMAFGQDVGVPDVIDVPVGAE